MRMPWAGSIIVAYSSENRCKPILDSIHTGGIKPQYLCSTSMKLFPDAISLPLPVRLCKADGHEAEAHTQRIVQTARLIVEFL
jgi:hypothetical protein